MLSKGDNNIWFRKRQPVPNEKELKNEKWPELEKPTHSHRDGFNETFPEFGKWKNKDAIDNPESILRDHSNVRRKNEAVQDSTSRSLTEKSFANSIYQDFKNQLKTNDGLDNNVQVISEREDTSRSRKEERKLAHKMLIKTKKEASRQEKQRQREEDILRKMVGPKGLGVSVIDAKTFSKFTKAEVNSPTTTNSFQQESSTMNDVNVDSFAFPELSLISKKSHVKSLCASRNRNYNIPIAKSVKGDQTSQYECCGNGREHVEDVHILRSKRPRRKRDPVIVDIMKAIEICKFDKKTNKIGGTDDMLIAKKKKNNNPQIIGNLLDSSNPKRHRGKKRERSNKRLTRLKKAVMAERERRKSQKEMNPSDSDANLCAHNYQPETKDKTIVSNADCVTLYNHGASHNFINYTRSECVQKLKDVSEIDKTSNLEKLDSAAAITEVDVEVMVREKLHTRKFREYCNHSNSTELSEAVKLMLQDIVRFQDRTHVNQPIKAESHRRYVVGLRQTQNLLSVHKIKVIVMASDIEKVPSPGGLDDLVHSIIDGAGKQCVPVVFPLQRRQLGKVVYRKVGISCVGILNYQGSESNFQRLIVTLEDAKKDYLEKFEKEKSRIMNNLGLCHIKKEENSSDVTVPLKMEAIVTLPLLQKLTEAISDVSLQSTCEKNVNDEH